MPEREEGAEDTGDEKPPEPLTPEQEQSLKKVAKLVADHTREVMRQDSFAFSILSPESNKEEQ